MYVCRWFVLCENVVQDKISNNLTMVNALTDIRATNFPVLHLRFSFAAKLERQGKPEGNLSLRFVRESESGDEILITAKGKDQTPEMAQFFTNFPMGIRLFKKGTVTFRIEAQEGDADWYPLGSQSIRVLLLEQSPKASSDEKGS